MPLPLHKIKIVTTSLGPAHFTRDRLILQGTGLDQEPTAHGVCVDVCACVVMDEAFGNLITLMFSALSLICWATLERAVMFDVS